MSDQRRRFIVWCVLWVFLLGIGTAAQSAERTYRFDCGTADSPVMAGYQRLTEADVYGGEQRFGWEGTRPRPHLWQEADVAQNKFASLGSSGQTWPQYIIQNATHVTRDGVTSPDDLVFRADLPNGSYLVTLTIGDLTKAVGSVKVSVNGKAVETPVTAWTPGGYRGLHKQPIGWWTTVRSVADVKDGTIRILLSKDQSHYDAEMAKQADMRNPFQYWWWYGAPKKDPPYHFISYPFTENSLMAIEIAPYRPAPVIGEGDRLKLTRSVASAALNQAISLFNQGEYARSLEALEGVRESDAQAARAIVSLWLAGRLEIESEGDLVPPALDALRDFLAQHPEETGIGAIVQDAEDFMRGYTYHTTRGQTGKIHFIENDKAIGWLCLVKAGSPLYDKAQLYVAFAGHQLSPYIPVLGMPEQILRRLETKYPDNRFVKYFLHWQWEPYGDGTHKRDWLMVDYAKQAQGAPAWVQSVYPAWATLRDWCEWFIKFKQEPEGSVGGGSGDDVEIVGAFGYVGYTGRGISDILIPGTSKLVDWVYTDTAVDPELGFCLPFADAEHSAEWTGNTLGMMMQIDYGNPLWIERSMKTGKLMRDLWTAYDNDGRRRFRANHFGAARVGTGAQMNDSWINYRAIRPASAVLWYSRNPVIAQLIVELADAWLASAMSTDRGKPAGVIPADVSYPEGTVGGVDSPNWFTASHPPGTVNYDWAGIHSSQIYKEYIQDLFLKAFEQTRDQKYLQPLRLEYELAAKYGFEPKEAKGGRLQEVDTDFIDKAAGRWTHPEDPMEETPQEQQQAGSSVRPGSEQWTARNLKGVEVWLTAKRMLEGRQGPIENDVTKDEIMRYGKNHYAMMKMRWPLMTTQASATDRAAFGGIVTPFLIYAGGRFGGPLLLASVTYEDTGRNFAASVMGTDQQGFRLLYYSLEPEEREIGLVPWDLEPGGTYVLKYGPDNNDDDVMDSLIETREFVLPQRGMPIPVKVKPRQAYVIEVDQVTRGKGAAAAADPGLSAADIRYDETTGQLLARIHNVGSKAVRDVEVAAYDGDPKEGGLLIGQSMIPNIEAPLDLEPRAVTVALEWRPTKDAHDVYVVVDPDTKIGGEITTFNNVAHKRLPDKVGADAPKRKTMRDPRAGSRGRR